MLYKYAVKRDGINFQLLKEGEEIGEGEIVYTICNDKVSAIGYKVSGYSDNECDHKAFGAFMEEVKFTYESEFEQYSGLGLEKLESHIKHTISRTLPLKES